MIIIVYHKFFIYSIHNFLFPAVFRQALLFRARYPKISGGKAKRDNAHTPFHSGHTKPKTEGGFPMLNHRKAAVIGCGFVGSACAFSLIQRGLFSELVLIDANADKAEGEAMDLSHGLPYIAAMDVRAGTYDDLSDCALIVVTAGANQKPGQTRLDLIGQNVAILNSIIPQITARPFEGILLIVSNPVDVLTYAAFRISGYPAHRVMGSGTVLDSARLKYLLGEHLNVDSRSIHAVIIGEHGDSELAVWSGANVSGVPLDNFCEMRGRTGHREAEERLYAEVRDSAYEIIRRKGATYYGIAMAVARIAEGIMKDERAILPVSVVLGGQYGLRELALSIPSIVGRRGVEQILDIPLADGEREKVAELFVYPCAVRVPDGTFPVNTPEELLEYYGEALEDHMGDLIPKLDYTTLFTRNGLVGVGDGAAWFGLVEDGEIRLFSLWSGQGLGVGPIVSEPTRG